jgi:hypothetical protein
MVWFGCLVREYIFTSIAPLAIALKMVFHLTTGLFGCGLLGFSDVIRLPLGGIPSRRDEVDRASNFPSGLFIEIGTRAPSPDLAKFSNLNLVSPILSDFSAWKYPLRSVSEGKAHVLAKIKGKQRVPSDRNDKFR